jgi:N-acetylglucosaminyl-diphospho-decaprenol L-rhamnosyltransferase
MDLSIIIVSYNVRDMLRDCLRALPEATKGLTTEVFVVDNASQDDSVEMVRAGFPDVRLTVGEENLGFARANNVALRQSAGRYVLLLNPDTEAEPESLTRLVRFMEDHPRAGACGPKLLNTDGSLQPHGARFPTLLRDFVCVTGLRRLAMTRYEVALGYGREDFDVLCEVDALSGACLLVRREVIDQVGLLDERFFMFSEEVEWCHRIKKAGWEVWYVPEVRVTHHWMGSVRQASREMTAQLFKSQVLYYQITAGPHTALGARAIMVLGLLKNSFIHMGVAAKRGLRRLGLVR